MKCRFILTQKSHGLLNDIASYAPWFPDHVIQLAGERAIPGCDINFYIEHPVPYFLNDAKIHVLMCNYEFITHVSTAHHAEQTLPHIHYVICKTHIAQQFCEKLKRDRGYRYQTVYTRHTTQLPAGAVPAKRDCVNWLHVGGKSPYKNTDIVIRAWQQHPEWPTLYVVCWGWCDKNLQRYVTPPWVRANIVDLGEQRDVAALQRRMQNHVCPSMVEGYGHYINEARAYSCFIVTMDYPPMNELVTADSGILAGCSSTPPKRGSPGVNSCWVDVPHFETVMARAIATPETERRAMARRAHQRFLADTQYFNKHMAAFVRQLKKELI